MCNDVIIQERAQSLNLRLCSQFQTIAEPPFHSYSNSNSLILQIKRDDNLFVFLVFRVSFFGININPPFYVAYQFFLLLYIYTDTPFCYSSKSQLDFWCNSPNSNCINKSPPIPSWIERIFELGGFDLLIAGAAGMIESQNDFPPSRFDRNEGC